ncbi:MAG: DUF3619 family protein [Rhodocyclales bacterium]|nr:DUF3619 family protein [Rhodocyclales bacterium]
MNDQDLKFAHKIRHILDLGTEQLRPTAAQRLFEARQQALSHQKAAVGGLSLASLGHFASTTLPTYSRTLVAALALTVGVVFTYYWTNFEQAAENEEVDSALLADDLPPAAFLDKGFQAWLERSSQSSQ